MRDLRQTVSFFAALLLLFCLAAPFAAARDVGNHHALIIGVGEYEHWDNLEAPPNDARQLARILVEKYNFIPKNVRKLISGESAPTRDAVLGALEQYSNTLTQEDNLLVFFSGRSEQTPEGDTYSIPEDGKKLTRMNWLKHTDLVNEFFNSQGLAAKNVVILLDSPLKPDYLEDKPNLLTPADLRYFEKLEDKAGSLGRLVIASGRHHEPAAGEESPGMGAFAALIVEALEQNTLALVDVESLLFPPAPQAPAQKNEAADPAAKPGEMALKRGRVKTDNDEGGLFVLRRIDTLPPIRVQSVQIEPLQGLPGEPVVIQAILDSPAQRAEMVWENQTLSMEGEGSHWTFTALPADPGVRTYTLVAYNEYEKAGEPAAYTLATIKPAAAPVLVESFHMEPETVYTDAPVTFFVATQTPAVGVNLMINGQTLAMEGQGTDWSLERTFEEKGPNSLEVVAFNADGQPGPSHASQLKVALPLVRVTQFSLAPKTASTGQKVLIRATTGQPARAVFLVQNDKRLPLQGKGRNWSLETAFDRAGRQNFSLVAQNAEGKDGPAKEAYLTVKKPLLPPDVTYVAVQPDNVEQGQEFTLTARTSSEAARVFLDILGQRQAMTGSGTRFEYKSVAQESGPLPFTATAMNKQGKSGASFSRTLQIRMRAPKMVTLVDVSAGPKRLQPGQECQFVARTDQAAKSVVLVVDGTPYPFHTDNGQLWILNKSFDRFGTMPYEVWAESSDGIRSNTVSGAILVRAPVIDISESFIEPGIITPGGEMIIIASTVHDAAGVEAQVNDQVYEMEGAGKQWRFKTLAPEGLEDEMRIRIRARNEEGRFGKAAIWTISFKN